MSCIISTIVRLMALPALIGFTSSPSVAQDGPLAFAASQAPEAGTGICHENSLPAAATCALNKCIAETGFEAEYCPIQTYCMPAGWAVDIFMQHQEGPHWHEFMCGWASREQLELAVTIACDSEWLIECSAVRIWSPQGEEFAL